MLRLLFIFHFFCFFMLGCSPLVCSLMRASWLVAVLLDIAHCASAITAATASASCYSFAVHARFAFVRIIVPFFFFFSFSSPVLGGRSRSVLGSNAGSLY